MAGTLIIGGGGMIGQKIAARLDGEHEATTFLDLQFPADASDAATRVTGSISDDRIIARLAANRPDVIFHLAAILSGESERDFDKGWQVNMFANWRLLEALRREHLASDGRYRPRLVFASSAAAFGPPFPGPVGDQFICEPRTSYGAQKVASELMIADFSRKGFIDGVSLRLPTICVRPGKPNSAASSFFSALVREPLNGRRASVPLPLEFRHMHASPRSAAGFFLHASRMDTDLLDNRRALNMPSVSCTIGEQIEALREAAGSSVVERIDMEPDPFIETIVTGWAGSFSTERARALGFEVEESFKDIIQAYIEDDLPADREAAKQG